MKLQTIALATALAMTSSLAFAQMGGGDASGAEVPESSGTAVYGNGGAVGPVDRGGMVREPGTTSGMSRIGQSGPTTDGGGRDMSRTGGEGVSRKPVD